MENKIKRFVLLGKMGKKEKIYGVSSRWGLEEKISGTFIGAGEKVIQQISEIDKEIFPEDPAKVKFCDGSLFSDTIKYRLSSIIQADEEELTESFPDYVKSLQIATEVMKMFYQLFQDCIYILYDEEKKIYEVSKTSCEKGSIIKASEIRHILHRKYILTSKVGWKEGPKFTPEEVCMADAGRVVRLRVVTERRAKLLKWTDRDKAINPELKAILLYVGEKCKYRETTLLFDTGVFFYFLAGLWHRGIRDTRVLAEIIKEDAKKILKKGEL